MFDDSTSANWIVYASKIGSGVPWLHAQVEGVEQFIILTQVLVFC